MRRGTWLSVMAGIATSMAVLSACGTAGAPAGQSPGTPAATQPATAAHQAQLAVKDTPLGRVLTDADGHTLYRFDKDTPTTSACSGDCASLWPPTLGTPSTSGGTEPTGALTTVTRPDGTVQAVYDGHPLYRYVKDTAPGQTNGDGVKGVWHVIHI